MGRGRVGSAFDASWPGSLNSTLVGDGSHWRGRRNQISRISVCVKLCGDQEDGKAGSVRGDGTQAKYEESGAACCGVYQLTLAM